ncbi:MAG: hypothetical protein ACXAEU_11015 [Candidatus Hodarchaeales archaeon]
MGMSPGFMDSQHWTRACYRLLEKFQHLTKGAAKGPTSTYQPLLAGRRYLQSRGLSSKHGSCFPVDNSGDKLSSRFRQS